MPRPRLELPPMTPSRDWKRRVCAFVGALPEDQGPYELTCLPRRMTASQQIRGYYFAVVVAGLANYLRGTGMSLPEGFDSFEDLSHQMIKQRCLSVPVVSADGEIVDHVVGSTAGMEGERFHQFVNDAREYVWDKFRVYTDDPDPDWRLRRADAAGARR